MGFVYEDSSPIYSFNEEISVNKPSNVENGEYIVEPKLPSGLKLNTKNGYISGIPTEIVDNSYTIIYNPLKKDEDKCILHIKSINIYYI